MASLAHYYRSAPIDETLTRAELVERLRLIWQGVQACPTDRAVMPALEFVIDALGLNAEQFEILGENILSQSDSKENNA